MNNFEFALVGAGAVCLFFFLFAMGVSHWHERKRHAHR